MSKEIQALSSTGLTLYRQIVRVSDGQLYNGSTFEAYTTANIATYAATLAEAGSASGLYTADFPTLAAGAYVVVVRQRVGGSPAESDPPVAAGRLDWDGSAVVKLSAINAKTVNLPADPAGLASLASAHGSGSWESTNVVVTASENPIDVAANFGEVKAFSGSDITLTVTITDVNGTPINVSAWHFGLYGALRGAHATRPWSVVYPSANIDVSSGASGIVKVTIDRSITESFPSETHDVDLWRQDNAADEDVKAYGYISWRQPARP